MQRKAHTSRYPRLQEFDQVLLTLEVYASYSNDAGLYRYRFQAIDIEEVKCNLSNTEEREKDKVF